MADHFHTGQMTETTEHEIHRGPEHDPSEEFGRWAWFVFGLMIGVMATAGLALIVTMNRDTSAPQAVVGSTTVAVGGGADDAAGKAIYDSTCTACHGVGAVGVTGLGPALADNAFVQAKTDAEMVAFIKEGRDPSHPDNTTGIAMPPKGGDPSLDDQDLDDVVAYLRTLQP